MSEINIEEVFKKLFRMKRYSTQFSQLKRSGKSSIIVRFEDLISIDHNAGKLLIEDPEEFLSHANELAFEELREKDRKYADTLKGVTVRFVNVIPEIALREIGSAFLNKFVSVEGIVVRASPVYPRLVVGAFRCKHCGKVQFIKQTRSILEYPVSCPGCKKRPPRFELDQEQSTFIDSQIIRIQEKPEDLPPGRLPQPIEVRLCGKDVVRSARPGDHVIIGGILRAFPQKKVRTPILTTFRMYLELNSIVIKNKEAELLDLTPEEEMKIHELSKDPWIYKKVAASIAPSIYGYDHIKEAAMYLLFGGVPKHKPDVDIRGELNILLVGDPGIAKSLLLQAVAKVAPRGLYTSGRGASAAGLTAAVLKDKEGGMYLEAGALVLADKGVCAIDEMDKMREEDRVAIHEALEQQTVSIAKGGIVATLNARTAVIAAANPKFGRYRSTLTVADNINLPPALISRFDLIFLMRDIPEPEMDREMTRHILGLHKIKPGQAPIPHDFLKKYICYARKIKPKLTTEAKKVISDAYLEMRKVSGEQEPEYTAIAITPRQLEALVRLAEAHARVALRDKVTVEDAQAALNIMKRSLKEVCFDVETGKIDSSIILTGRSQSEQNRLIILMDVIKKLVEEMGGSVEDTDVIEEMEKKNIPPKRTRELLRIAEHEGFILHEASGQVKLLR